MANRCAVIGIGQTKHTDKRHDVNHIGLTREACRRALEDAAGDKQRAAEALGISYRTLQRRVKKYDLDGYPDYR